MQIPSEERIALMDAILNEYLKSSKTDINYEEFTKVQSVPRNEFEPAKTAVLKGLRDFEFVKIEVLPDGSAALIRWLAKTKLLNLETKEDLKITIKRNCRIKPYLL